MGSGPTILALETDSAWVVILAVSAVTLVAALVLRRVIARPGGLASGLLLAVPLVLPLVAALVYEHAVLPEIAVLRPVDEALVHGGRGLLRLLLVSDGQSGLVRPYALYGSVGPWLLVIGGTMSSLMLLRRAAGTVLVNRLVRRCRPLAPSHGFVKRCVEDLSWIAGIKAAPEVLLLPEGVSGAFAVGVRPGRILLSEDLIDRLDHQELEAILAHEIAHIEAKDVPMVFAAGLLRDVVAWNPLAHFAYRRLVADREFEADRRAAAITGKPLAVASGLLKLCELMRGGRRHHYREAVAALRPGGRITKRVSNLIAMADGVESFNPAGRLPYMMAVCLVAVLGLQVGERLTQHDSSAFALVLGTPTTDATVWTPPRRANVPGRPGKSSERVVKPGRLASSDLGLPLRHRELLSGDALKVKDFPKWVAAMTQLGKTKGLSDATLRWLAQKDHQWQATPLWSQSMVPVTVYRMDQQPL